MKMHWAREKADEQTEFRSREECRLLGPYKWVPEELPYMDPGLLQSA